LRRHGIGDDMLVKKALRLAISYYRVSSYIIPRLSNKRYAGMLTSAQYTYNMISANEYGARAPVGRGVKIKQL